MGTACEHEGRVRAAGHTQAVHCDDRGAQGALPGAGLQRRHAVHQHCGGRPGRCTLRELVCAELSAMAAVLPCRACSSSVHLVQQQC